MKSEWRVSRNPVDGDWIYGVYRLFDIQKTDHSGNRETYAWYEDLNEAEKKAAQLNKEEEDEWNRIS